MATEDHQPAGGIVRQLVDSAGTVFVLITLVLPIVAALVAVGTGNRPLLNLVHVASGATWAGATLYVGGILGPTLLGLEPPVRGQVNTPMIPKNVFLFSGVALATLVTGPVMAVQMGMWNLADQYLLGAVVLGLALLVAGAYLVWLQVLVFGEAGSPGPPDAERLAALGGRIGQVSPLMVLLQLAILVDMSLLAVG